MAIESNEGGTQSAPKSAASKTEGTFAGTTFNDGGSAPGGALDFLSLSHRVGVDQIDSAVEPYLEKVMKVVNDKLPNASLERILKMSNTYVVRYAGPDSVTSYFGIMFISTSDPITQEMYPPSIRMSQILKEISEQFHSDGSPLRLSDARLILSGYGPDMERGFEMGATIVRTFSVTADPVAKNAKIQVINTTEFVADWRITEARTAERALSPHGVPARMDIGLTLKAKVNTIPGKEFRDFGTEHRTVGVIGGYTEILNKEPRNINGTMVPLYQPVFHITVWNSMIPLEGIGGILLAAFAPAVYRSLFWTRQWADLGDNKPQPGLLEEDISNKGKPYILKNPDELQEFIRMYFAPPVIVVDFQDGRDGIPGMWRMTSDQAKDRQFFLDRLTQFFDVAEEANPNVTITRQIDLRYDGVYGDAKGVLEDSRNLDYLTLAAKAGVSAFDKDSRAVLLGGSSNPTDRARVIQNATNSFIPTSLNTVSLINPAFIGWIIEKTEQRGLRITDPSAQSESRPFGSFLEGFGDSQNIGSIVTNGITNRGSSLSSFWH